MQSGVTKFQGQWYLRILKISNVLKLGKLGTEKGTSAEQNIEYPSWTRAVDRKRFDAICGCPRLDDAKRVQDFCREIL